MPRPANAVETRRPAPPVPPMPEPAYKPGETVWNGWSSAARKLTRRHVVTSMRLVYNEEEDWDETRDSAVVFFRPPEWEYLLSSWDGRAWNDWGWVREYELRKYQRMYEESVR